MSARTEHRALHASHAPPALQTPRRAYPAHAPTLASMPERLIITIDGPAGTGKSSVAQELASRLGVKFLDTGAMYRAAAAITIDEGLPLDDPAALVAAIERHSMHFDFDQTPPELLCSGRSMMNRVRAADVTRVVSPIAGIPELRRELVQKQRQIAVQYPRLVAEGRDQGTVVFPDADVKFYLHASARVRAERRARQLNAPERADEIERDIIARDQCDEGRSDGPLKRPPDAHDVDTSDLAFEQVVAALEAHVRRHVLVREGVREGLRPTLPRRV